MAFASDDEALPGSEPTREERGLHGLSRAERFAEDGFRGVCEAGSTGTKRRCPTHESQQTWRLIKTILLTRHEEEAFIAAALAAGVKGYVLKS